ncbi:metal-dependent hydrolase [Polaribacter reichenbachii]|uniref:Metal-dependent hydrolase n=1 Tax=Polaribacter reichenbachii TaxID=996801 RepID=A0A1B8U029_9FLAO|nr:metal-dependent hydrolase [Polaribacter reichenbachii]APZ47187.1 metal-dependent hydrolase [Polaribacter reichenbachii]AUC17827.1 metal-dependent hydrolase [Polaribacter reichenbachii]OBY65149.1 metal-dependent hydrolase [Polaribacter reichenbachii]
MDSLTQIVLGAAVGEAVLGRKIGNKAMLYGAIAGTIPDLDVLSSFFTDKVTALEIHRGFTHSILFSIIFAPFFSFIVNKYEKYKSFKNWSWFFFWTFITHPILDAQTTWGTQLFWPFDIRLAFKNVFVVDPLYTLPFLVFLILAMCKKRASKKRRFYNNLGLIISSSYLIITLILKGISYQKFTKELSLQNIIYSDIKTKPTPFNTILWTANINTKNAFLIGNSSFFDKNPIHFTSYPKNHHLLGNLMHHKKVKRMISISKGWYTINKKDGVLYFNDLRFGTLSIKPNATNFVFKYKITVDENGTPFFIEEPKKKSDAKKLVSELWQRIKGN